MAKILKKETELSFYLHNNPALKAFLFKRGVAIFSYGVCSPGTFGVSIGHDPSGADMTGEAILQLAPPYSKGRHYAGYTRKEWREFKDFDVSEDAWLDICQQIMDQCAVYMETGGSYKWYVHIIPVSNELKY